MLLLVEDNELLLEDDDEAEDEQSDDSDSERKRYQASESEDVGVQQVDFGLFWGQLLNEVGLLARFFFHYLYIS